MESVKDKIMWNQSFKWKLSTCQIHHYLKCRFFLFFCVCVKIPDYWHQWKIPNDCYQWKRRNYLLVVSWLKLFIIPIILGWVFFILLLLMQNVSQNIFQTCWNIVLQTIKIEIIQGVLDFWCIVTQFSFKLEWTCNFPGINTPSPTI